MDKVVLAASEEALDLAEMADAAEEMVAETAVSVEAAYDYIHHTSPLEVEVAEVEMAFCVYYPYYFT